MSFGQVLAVKWLLILRYTLVIGMPIIEGEDSLSVSSTSNLTHSIPFPQQREGERVLGALPLFSLSLSPRRFILFYISICALEKRETSSKGGPTHFCVCHSLSCVGVIVRLGFIKKRRNWFLVLLGWTLFAPPRSPPTHRSLFWHPKKTLSTRHSSGFLDSGNQRKSFNRYEIEIEA